MKKVLFIKKGTSFILNRNIYNWYNKKLKLG